MNEGQKCNSTMRIKGVVLYDRKDLVLESDGKYRIKRKYGTRKRHPIIFENK